MNVSSQASPKLIDLLRPVPTIDAGILVREAIRLFNSDPGLLAIPVIKDGTLIGLLRRTAFFRSLSRPYALELFNKLPVRELLEAKPFSMCAWVDIHQALALLLQVDPALENDCFPIDDDGRCLGIVAVSDLMMGISRDQMRLLGCLEELSSRIRNEVENAAGIQRALLPPVDFHFPDIELAAELVNSTEVGGDYYDYFAIDEHRIGVVIADVSGHGVQAGMVTTAAKASLVALVGQGVTTPRSLLTAMNGAILATARKTLLMTCLIAFIDIDSRCIRYANAGHNFPYLYRWKDRSLEMLQDAGGFPLGFDMDIDYQERTVPFEPGDTFICYSDGINECSNGCEDFGYERLEKSIRRHVGSPSKDMVAGILDDIRQYANRDRFEDDVTLMIAHLPEAISDVRQLKTVV